MAYPLLVSSMDYPQTLARIYEHLEEDHVEKAVMGCLRVARATNDYLNAAIFLRELYPRGTEVARLLHEDMSHLSKEQRKFLYEASGKRWLELHTMDYVLSGDPTEEELPEGDRHTVLNAAAGDIQSRIDQWEHSIADMALPSGMGEFDTAAFTDRLLRN